MLESLKANWGPLRAVVGSDEWTTWLSGQSFADVGEHVADLILSPTFRKKVQELIDISTPVVKALRKFDGNVPVASKVYRTMYDTVEAMKSVDIAQVCSFIALSATSWLLDYCFSCNLVLACYEEHILCNIVLTCYDNALFHLPCCGCHNQKIWMSMFCTC